MNALFRTMVGWLAGVPAFAAAGILQCGPEEPARVVRQGAVLRTSTLCRNPTDRPIEIREIETGCACLTAIADHPTVPPGGATRVRFVLRTETLNERVSFPVELRAASGTEPLAVHEVNADVRPAVIAIPGYVDLGNFRRGQPQTVVLVDTTGRDVHIRQAQTERGSVDVTWTSVELVRMGDHWQVTPGRGAVSGVLLRIQPHAGREVRRSLSDEVQVDLVHPVQPQVRIRVVGYSP